MKTMVRIFTDNSAGKLEIRLNDFMTRNRSTYDILDVKLSVPNSNYFVAMVIFKYKEV